MALKYFNADSDTADIVSALRRDGAAIVTEQIAPEIAEQHSATIQRLMGYQTHNTLGSFQHPDGKWFKN